jgi:hypothetical protein
MSRIRFCAVTLTPSAPSTFCVGTERDESKDNQNEQNSRHFKLLQAMRKNRAWKVSNSLTLEGVPLRLSLFAYSDA